MIWMMDWYYEYDHDNVVVDEGDDEDDDDDLDDYDEDDDESTQLN
jgi:hypothetical protein